MDTKTGLAIFGVDAGDPEYITKWIREGHLPNIASIMQEGVWAKTGGAELVSEHGVWVSLLSGISRVQHGYYYFRQLKKGTYELETVKGSDIDAPPFWSQLVGDNTEVVIIDAPETPKVKGLRGAQLINWASHQNWDPTSYPLMSEPHTLLDIIEDKFGSKKVTIENNSSTYNQDVAIYRGLLDQIKLKGQVARYLLENKNPELFTIVFAESHVANHQFWKYLRDGTQNGDDNSELINAVRDVYSAIDREIGLIRKQLSSNYNTVVLSSVGMEDDYPNSDLSDAFCKQLGYQALYEQNGFSLHPLDLVRKLLPQSTRVALSKLLPRERREQLLSDQFRRDTDWSKTKAFSIPVSYTSFIYINLKGREPQGIVSPGHEYKTLLDELETELSKIIDPTTNTPAVYKIHRTTEIFDCDPYSGLPDLFVEWKPGSFMDRVEHPGATLRQSEPEFFRRSDHSSQGFFAACGPSIQSRGAREDINILDLAPTFLDLLNHQAPDYMGGKVIKL